MLAQGLEGLGYYLVCAIVGLIVLGMAANEWLRLGSDKFRRITLVGLVIFSGRLIGVVVLLTGSERAVAYQEWVLEALILAMIVWAFQIGDLLERRRASRFLIGTAVAMGSLLILSVVLQPRTSYSVPAGLWVATLLLSLFALAQWLRHRRRFSVWLGSAFVVSSLSAIGGLVGVVQLALLAHLALLVLVALESYGAVLSAVWGGGRLRAGDRQTWQHTQEIAFLLAVSGTLSDSLELQVVLGRISEAVARAISADWAYVLMPEGKDDGELVVAARYGWWGRRWTQDSHPSRRMAIKVDELSLIRHAILRRRSVLANTPEDYEQFECLHDRFARPQSGPALIQPVTRQNRTLGVLLLGRVDLAPRKHGPTGREFTEADAQLCQDLMAHIATAIHNARLHQSAVERAEQAAELLRQQESETSRLRAILDSIPAGVLVVTATGNVLLANVAAERILNVPRQHFLGRIIAPLQARMQRGELGQADDRAPFAWDDKLLMSQVVSVRQHDGTLQGAVVVFRDVTAEQHAERARAEYVEAFAGALEDLLGSIQTDTDLLAENLAESSSALQGQLLERGRNHLLQMSTLLRNFALLSSMEEDAIQIEARSVDMTGIIDKAVELVRPKVGIDDLEIAVSPSSELRPVWGDPELLRQIVVNLLDHAVHRTPAGGRIDVWAEETSFESQDGASKEAMAVGIRDPGKAIPPAQQAHLFEPFHPLGNADAAASVNIRVGLAVSEGIVRAHGGHISVASAPGEGTTLSFSVPVVDGE